MFSLLRGILGNIGVATVSWPQSFVSYLRQGLVFVWDSTPGEVKFLSNLGYVPVFRGIFASIGGIFIFEGDGALGENCMEFVTFSDIS